MSNQVSEMSFLFINSELCSEFEWAMAIVIFVPNSLICNGITQFVIISLITFSGNKENASTPPILHLDLFVEKVGKCGSVFSNLDGLSKE